MKTLYLTLWFLFVAVCTAKSAGQIEFIDIEGQFGSKPEGQFAIFDGKILTFLDSSLVVIEKDEINILREMSFPGHEFEFIYSTPQKLDSCLRCKKPLNLYKYNWSNNGKQTKTI